MSFGFFLKNTARKNIKSSVTVYEAKVSPEMPRLFFALCIKWLFLFHRNFTGIMKEHAAAKINRSVTTEETPTRTVRSGIDYIR